MPARADYIARALRNARYEFVEAHEHDDQRLLRVHDAAFVDFLRSAYTRWREEGKDGSMLPSGFPARSLRRDRLPAGINGALGYYAFDAGTPIVDGTWEAARGSAHCALSAAEDVLDGARAAYALCRPPGHHAARGAYGGYCFLNNAAIAAQRLRDGGIGRVAVLDIDYHHGNGTQDIFWTRGDVLTVSIHGTPETEYPWFLGFDDETGEGEGDGCNLNLPLPRGTAWPAYAATLDAALAAIRRFAPEALVVSLGVDTFEGDPISEFRLGGERFPEIGGRIAALDLPTVLVQEGGYAVDEIGRNVAGVLGAFASGG